MSKKITKLQKMESDTVKYFHPTRIFSKISKEKFKAAPLKLKCRAIGRLSWALVKILLFTIPLALLTIVAVFLDVLSEWLTEKFMNDSAVSMILDGLFSEPNQEVKSKRYTPTNLKWGR